MLKCGSKMLLVLSASFLLSACEHLTMECEHQAQIPKELTEPLGPPRLAANQTDFIEAHLYNMERLGVCYAKYEALVEAVNARED